MTRSELMSTIGSHPPLLRTATNCGFRLNFGGFYGRFELDGHCPTGQFILARYVWPIFRRRQFNAMKLPNANK
jgi:hypothetical protein